MNLIALFALPILLIHGYGEDASVWSSWIKWLKLDNFTRVFPVGFANNDRCGSVKDHEGELATFIDKVRNETHSKEVDIIGHSHGGLEGRWYVAHHPGKVANLVMLGTPNRGTEAAAIDLTDCTFANNPGLFDLLPGSEASNIQDSNSTKYWVLAGNLSSPCYFVIVRSICGLVENDGLVTKDSAISHYESLGVFRLNHTGLTSSINVYNKVLPVLRSTK